MALTKSILEIIADDRTGLLSKHASWERVKLDDVAVVLNGFAFESKYFSSNGGTPLIRIRDVVAGETDTFYAGEFDRQYLVQPGELLIGMDGDFNSARWRSAPGLLNQRVCKITVNDRFYIGKLLEYALPSYLDAINVETSSVTVKHLSSRTVEDIELPLPPLKEQTRIVAKLDELLSDLDAGVAELEAAKKKLTQYRQSLLKAATEGALTAEWRKHNKPKETGAQLLERILKERRARWEEGQLTKFKEQGKVPPRGWQERYPAPSTPDTNNLPDLPKNWVWASLDQMLSDLRSGTAETSGREITEYPVLKSSAVRQGRIDFDALNYLRAEQSRRHDNYLGIGDVLITRLSGSVEYVGCCAIVHELPAAGIQYPDRIFCGKLVPALLNSGDFLACCLQSAYARKRIERAAKSTAGHKRISLTDLHPCPIPLPSIDEMREVLRQLDDARERVEWAELAVEKGIRQSVAQRKNILKAAFSGQLVPQDPHDEPASVLLERIRAERLAKAQSTAKRAVRKQA